MDISVPPGPNRDFFTPSDKTRYFSYPLRLFTPIGQFFFSQPPQTVLSNFTPNSFFPPISPPRTVFFVNFAPSDSFFHQFYPPQTVYFDNLTPSDIFLTSLPPLTVYITKQKWWFPPPSNFFNGIALSMRSKTTMKTRLLVLLVILYLNLEHHK